MSILNGASLDHPARTWNRLRKGMGACRGTSWTIKYGQVNNSLEFGLNLLQIWKGKKKLERKVRKKTRMICPASILDYRVCTTTKNRFLFVHKNKVVNRAENRWKLGKKRKLLLWNKKKQRGIVKKRTRFDALLEMEKEMNWLNEVCLFGHQQPSKKWGKGSNQVLLGVAPALPPPPPPSVDDMESKATANELSARLCTQR